MLNTGRDPRLGTEPLRNVRVESAARFVERMKSSRKEAEAALHKAADDMARYYDRNRQQLSGFDSLDIKFPFCTTDFQ